MPEDKRVTEKQKIERQDYKAIFHLLKQGKAGGNGMKINLRLEPRGNSRSVILEKETTIESLYRKYEEELPYTILAAKVDNKIEDLNFVLQKDCDVELLDMRTQAANLIYQNSLCLIYLKAIDDVLGNVEVDIENALNKGLFTEIKTGGKITAKEIHQIEKRMRELVEADIPFVKEEVTEKEAGEIFLKNGQPEKFDILLEEKDSRKRRRIPFYSLNGYRDFFYGLMTPSTGYIRYFQVMKYRRGVLLRFPHPSAPDRIPEYVDEKMLYKTFGEQSLSLIHILTTDWHWSPYGTIAGEIGRSIETFRLFNEKRAFNGEDFRQKTEALLKQQDRLVIILNTPAHNPTGYSLTLEDWNQVAEVLNHVPQDKKITLLVDMAYLDFAGEGEKYREFFPVLDQLNSNILPVIAHSLSKAYTLYGMRCGAMICMAKSQEVAQEFKRVCEYSSRGSWSNCCRAPQVILTKIYEDPALLERVHQERAGFRDMLLRRGKAFEKAAEQAGLEVVPFDAGFFISVPCDDPDRVSAELEKEGIFTVPLAKGIRVSVASISEERCRMLPERILEAIRACEK